MKINILGESCRVHFECRYSVKLVEHCMCWLNRQQKRNKSGPKRIMLLVSLLKTVKWIRMGWWIGCWELKREMERETETHKHEHTKKMIWWVSTCNVCTHLNLIHMHAKLMTHMHYSSTTFSLVVFLFLIFMLFGCLKEKEGFKYSFCRRYLCVVSVV